MQHAAYYVYFEYTTVTLAHGAGTGTGQGAQLLMPAMPSVQASNSLAATAAVHVTGFGKVVDVFNSKQRPKNLTMYGDDFK